MASTQKSSTKVFGPFSCLSAIYPGSDGGEVLTIPYDTVRNASLAVLIEDNVGQALSALAQPGAGVPNIEYTNIGAHVVIAGAIQGYQTVLKRQFIRSTWGAGMVYNFQEHEVFDKVIVKARLMVGGKPQFPTNIVFANVVQSPLFVNLQVLVCARSGVGK